MLTVQMALLVVVQPVTKKTVLIHSINCADIDECDITTNQAAAWGSGSCENTVGGLLVIAIPDTNLVNEYDLAAIMVADSGHDLFNLDPTY